MKLTEAIPRLRELLSDSATWQIADGAGEWKDVYYVRNAARAALETMGEHMEAADEAAGTTGS